jgi:hypothetical protein
MPRESAQFEPVAWWWTRREIGRDLSERYDVPKELPPKLLALVRKLDAVEGNYSLRYSGTTPDRSADDPGESDLLFPSASWKKDDLLAG